MLAIPANHPQGGLFALFACVIIGSVFGAVLFGASWALAIPGALAVVWLTAMDIKKVFYLTDTGRMWDGHKVSVRDKVEDHFGLSFHSTPDVIDYIGKGNFPSKVMFNFHPQRWTDDKFLWLKEKNTQQFKNLAKYLLIQLK